VVHNLPAKDRLSILLAVYELTHYLRHSTQRGQWMPVSHLSPAHAPHGIHILGSNSYCDSWLQSGTEVRGPTQEIRPSDVVWFPPGEKHWHSATATTTLTHIAIQEQLGGKTVDCMEKVSDEQYRVAMAAHRSQDCDEQ
jgi:hypothetical protein